MRVSFLSPLGIPGSTAKAAPTLLDLISMCTHRAIFETKSPLKLFELAFCNQLYLTVLFYHMCHECGTPLLTAENQGDSLP